MTAEQWRDLAFWAAIGGLILSLLTAVVSLAALTRDKGPARKPERDRLAALLTVLIGSATAVMISLSTLQPENASAARTLALAAGAAAVAFVGVQLWLARRVLRLTREDSE